MQFVYSTAPADWAGGWFQLYFWCGIWFLIMRNIRNSTQKIIPSVDFHRWKNHNWIEKVFMNKTLFFQRLPLAMYFHQQWIGAYTEQWKSGTMKSCQWWWYWSVKCCLDGLSFICPIYKHQGALHLVDWQLCWMCFFSHISVTTAKRHYPLPKGAYIQWLYV